MESTDVDVVDTSDVEEREVVLSEDGGPRPASTPMKRIRVPTPPQSAPTERSPQRRASPLLTSRTRDDKFRDLEVGTPSPRKRTKIAHITDLFSHHTGFPIHTETYFTNSPSGIGQIPSLTPKYHPTRVSSDEDEVQLSVSFTRHNGSPLAVFDPLFTSLSQPLVEHSSPGATSQVRVRSMEVSPSPPSPPQLLSCSLSTSTDQNRSIFSSPRRLSTPRAFSQHSYDQSSSGRRRLQLAPSSPLTPVSSPIVVVRPESPDPLQLVSARRPQAHIPSQSDSPLDVPHAAHSSPIEIPPDPQPLNRYSLRRREARQLNPYAYDKLLYKQQLKSHPDAIVKFRSPRHRSGSREGNQDGTQDFIFPIDNPEEDGDYVDVEGKNGRKKGSNGVDRDDETVGDFQEGTEARPVDEGWLPEALKELSSSDDDDTEIQKLAKRIRREREKAQAMARAEARKLAKEARQAELENKKRRLKPFPIRENGGRTSTNHPRRDPSPVSLEYLVVSLNNVKQERFSSLFLSPRANSEPVTSRPATPARLPRGPSVSPRALSHSPTSSSKFPGSLGFSVYLRQDDFNGFDDHVAPLPPILSPGDQSVTYPIPSSPSGPPTTSGASALPSNTSGIDSESDHSSIVEMNSKDRKRLRVLKRMMPAAMIARQLELTKAAHRTHPPGMIAAESSGSEAEEARLIPGLARVRRGKYRDAEVRGDSESSDMERPTEVDKGAGEVDAGLEMLSDGESAVKVKRTRHASPQLKHEDEVISLSNSSVLGSSSEDAETGSGDDEKAHDSLFDRPERGPTREGSLIDWMLCRNRSSGKPKTRFKQPARSRKSRGSGPPRLHIVTSGARRYGEHHQTLLPFARTGTGSSAIPSTGHRSERGNQTARHNEDMDKEIKKRKKWKRQSGAYQSIFNFHHDATRLLSKHREGKSSRSGTALIIENDDDECRRALDPGWRTEVERWNRPVSPTPQPFAKTPTSAPTVPRPRLYRRASPPPQTEFPIPFYFLRKEEPFSTLHHRIIVDMNITPLPSGVKFGASSYIERGFLYQLISVTSGNSEAGPPPYCNMQGFEISSSTSAAVFTALLGPLCDRLASALRDFSVDDADTVKEWNSLTRTSSQLLSWLAIHAEDQEFIALEVALREYLDGLALVLESLETNIFSLTAHWFVLEAFARFAIGVKYRRGSTENGPVFQSAKQLIQHLLGVDLQPAFVAFHEAEGNVDVTFLPHRAAELWVCLIHLLGSFESSSEAAPGHLLWRLLGDLHAEFSPTGLEASEEMWRTILSLCAISQFSVHGLSTSVFRLPAAWELVTSALKKIVLTDNPEKDHQLPQRALKKRDDYVSCVVSRCFLLWSRWGWRLDDGVPMFKSLQEIFRSRNFANLLSERSIPMGFLESGDLELLSKQDPHDSIFEVFLKMVVQAVYLLNANVELDPKQRSAHIKKLLQIAVPVSPVPFSRSAPPSAHSLSMLVNRFSAMAVAVHLDPAPSNVKFRIVQARRCVSFRNADDQSRVACVYGMMNFAMIVRHHKVTGGLEEVLGWLAEMADILMDEYKEGEGAVGKKTTTTLIQLLIGSVRRVVETASLDKGQIRAEYPDPALLDGPWVTRVFNPRTDLVTIQQTGVEIRMLVQTFLDARLKALPATQLPPPSVVHGIESQESQDEYDRLFLDLNDEELLAALGEETEASNVADLKLKEDALCKVLDKFITPAVYRLVCKHFGENERAKNDPTSVRVADEWIDCWVGCANVLVQNKYKEWGLYMKLGQQSWEKIIDNSWRRRVGLRFNLMLLRLDPGAYNKMKDEFVAVLLVATLSCKTTIEHEFIGIVLSLDGLQHPLLRGAPFDCMPGTKKYEVGPTDYKVARERLIQTVFANTARCLGARVDAESQAYAELVVMMLSTMRDIYESAEDKETYGGFCRRVYDVLMSHGELVSHSRMADALEWGRKLSP